MKKRLQQGAMIIIATMILTGCVSQHPIGTPCPNFGRQCVQQPVNSWNPKA